MFRVDGGPIRVKKFAVSGKSGIHCVDGASCGWIHLQNTCSLEFFWVGVCQKRLQTLRYPVLVKIPFL